MENKRNTWEVLSKINCNDKTEKKNGLTYLSWAWAWGIVKANFPDANYIVHEYEGKPYLYDADLGYIVKTSVTIQGDTIPMHLPVMDGANKAQKNHEYTYEVAEWKNGQKTGKIIQKKVEPATMFDINTAIMRCLTKNLAMFGLGHYIYAGEDLPKVVETEEKINDYTLEIANAKTQDELKAIYEKVKGNKGLVALITARKKELENG